MITKAMVLLLVSVVLVSGCTSQPETTDCGASGDPSGCGADSGSTDTDKTGGWSPTDGVPGSAEDTSPKTHTIEMIPSGYEPKTLTIKASDTVTFVNKGVEQNWPASAFHPTHTAYPGSGIEKCGSGEEIFDACGHVSNSWSFTFNEKGEWKYHNHLNPGQFGSIKVE